MALLFAGALGCDGEQVPLGNAAGMPGAGATGGEGSGGAPTTGTGGVVGTGGMGSGGAPTTGTGGAGGESSGGPGISFPTPTTGTVKSKALDVLFVVDNSISMADKQAQLADSIPDFVQRLTNPACVVGGVPTAEQPASGLESCPPGAERVQPPANDLHIGVITSSLGGQPQEGSAVATGICADEELTKNDHAHLIGPLRGVPTHDGLGFLKWDPQATDVDSLIADTQALVQAAGEQGCGLEAPLEAMYRFLVDPNPHDHLQTSGGRVQKVGTDASLVAQRAAFLRPDSTLLVVLVSDENDCSIRTPGVGWAMTQTTRMFPSTSACEADPNHPCCRSCGLAEAEPPQGCSAILADPACQDQRLPVSADHPNVRCFDQQRRFGLDLLFPTARYVVGLTEPTLCPDSNIGDADCNCRLAAVRGVECLPGEPVPNPLFVSRDPSQVVFATLTGVPWPDIAPAPEPGTPLEFMTASELSASGRWDTIVGWPSFAQPPSDVFMQESIQPRTGENSVTGQPTLAPEADGWTLNGHEYHVPNNGDLQYACVFQIPERDCLTAIPGGGCDCDDEAVANANPLCKAPGGSYGTTQYFAKAYPGLRQLEVARFLDQRSVVSSICSANSLDPTAPNYAHIPALAAMARRVGSLLE